MYEGLYEGLRRACHLELFVTEEITTNERRFCIWRTFKKQHFKLWEMNVAKNVLIQGGQYVFDEIYYQIKKVELDIFNSIFNEVDWDRFLDPWYMGVTHADKIEVFRRKDPEAFTDPNNLLIEPFGIIWGDYDGDPANY